MRQRIYIAGAAVEWQQARRMMRAVSELGYHLTLDWTLSIEEHEAAGVTDRQLTALDARRLADEDVNAVQASDVVWLLVPPDGKGRGAWVELGIALASPRCQIIASGDVESSIFLQLVDKQFATHEEALVWLKEVRKD